MIILSNCPKTRSFSTSSANAINKVVSTTFNLLKFSKEASLKSTRMLLINADLFLSF